MNIAVFQYFSKNGYWEVINLMFNNSRGGRLKEPLKPLFAKQGCFGAIVLSGEVVEVCTLSEIKRRLWKFVHGPTGEKVEPWKFVHAIGNKKELVEVCTKLVWRKS